MAMNEQLLDHLQKRKTDAGEVVPEGFCPNCWGREEYGGKFYEAVELHHHDVKTPDPDVGWVQDYVDRYLAGIALEREDKGYVCKNCKVSYRPQP